LHSWAARRRARRAGEGYTAETHATADEEFVRERAANADNFDPAELPHGHRSEHLPPFALAVAPILIVLAVNLIMSLLALAMLPHNGAVVTLLAICGATQRGSYREIMMVGLVGPLIALSVVIALGKLFGAF
jgi:hypothetical protein